jgi:cytochrome c-type biogenesis protein CcmF
MDYVGELLLPGQIGHFLAILSFVASLVATFSFFKAIRPESYETGKTWQRLARWAFAVESLAVAGLFITLYFIISGHHFEYKYAWQHSSKSLQVEYLLSCFWEGQEGSFMLWSFWHCVLGWFVIGRSGKWEAPVMTIVSFAQAALATMLMGIYFFGNKVGTSPFVLLRNEMEAPIFSRADYLNFVTDGNGLNALLQNYWMVIHPPVLFLGFAATLFPFAFAMAGLITRDHKGWAAPALPWGMFAAAVLGLGIMMGAAWAYESLTFGGYWAWDPVENASLVPWLLLISGIHTNLIYKHSGFSLKSTYLFYVLSFILVLYSTFLTRSGILGDSSVHAFTDLGMNVQLYLFLNLFIWVPAMLAVKTPKHRLFVFAAFAITSALSLQFSFFALISSLGGLFLFTWLVNTDKAIPAITREENVYSREFWMFIGSLIFFLSAAVIISKTSLPVINKIFDTKIASPEDVEFSHNNIQVWVALILGLLTAITQYFRYKDTPKAVFFKKIAWPAAITLVLGGLISGFQGVSYMKQGPGFWLAIHLAIFAAVFSVVANAGYIYTGLKGKLKVSGASVAHIGFGLVLLGILLSSGNKTVLSINTTGISPLKATDKENSLENTTLIKGQPTDMGRFMVTYTRDTLNLRDHKRYFEIEFLAKDSSEKFNLYPDVIENNKGGEGLTPNPDAKHYFGKDIFAYVTFLSDPEAKQKDTTAFTNKTVVVGDTLFYSNGMWVLNGLEVNPRGGRFDAYIGDTVLAADISVITKDGRQYKSRPGFVLRGTTLELLPDTVMSQSLVFSLIKPGDIQKREVEIGIKESSAILDFLTLKVYEFPWINILWLGVVVVTIGFIMAIIRRVKLSRSAKEST